MSSDNPAIKLFQVGELERPKGSRFLVRDILPRTGVAIVWGEPKSGKTFWVLNLAFHVATGRPLQGLAVKQGPVVYGCFEGQFGIADRIHAMREYLNDGQTFPLVTCKETLVFDKKGRTHRRFLKAIRPVQPALVVLDTLHRSLQGSEMKDEDMHHYTNCALEISQELDCLVLAVHHPGKNGDGPRGHSSLTGTVDCQLEVWRDRNDMVYSKVEFAKDIEPGHQLRWMPRIVEMPKDEDGFTVTTCLLDPVEGPGAAREREKSEQTESPNAPTSHELKMLGMLMPLIESDGWAHFDTWRDVCVRCDDIYKSKDLYERRRRFNLRLQEMKVKKLVEQDIDKIRLTEKGIRVNAA